MAHLLSQSSLKHEPALIELQAKSSRKINNRCCRELIEGIDGWLLNLLSVGWDNPLKGLILRNDAPRGQNLGQYQSYEKYLGRVESVLDEAEGQEVVTVMLGTFWEVQLSPIRTSLNEQNVVIAHLAMG